MALITCPECGGQVSDKAESCPHCGYPLKEIIDNNKDNDNSNYDDNNNDDNNNDNNNDDANNDDDEKRPTQYELILDSVGPDKDECIKIICENLNLDVDETEKLCDFIPMGGRILLKCDVEHEGLLEKTMNQLARNNSEAHIIGIDFNGDVLEELKLNLVSDSSSEGKISEDVSPKVNMKNLAPMKWYTSSDKNIYIECGNCKKVYGYKKELFPTQEEDYCICSLDIICPNCKNGISKGTKISAINNQTSKYISPAVSNTTQHNSKPSSSTKKSSSCSNWLVGIVVIIIIICIMGSCSGGGTSVETYSATCQVCGKTYSYSSASSGGSGKENVQNIRKTNMCISCYKNFQTTLQFYDAIGK